MRSYGASLGYSADPHAQEQLAPGRTGCLTHLKIRIRFIYHIHGEAVSVTAVSYNSTSSLCPGLLYGMIRLVVGAGTSLWFHVLAAVFEGVIKVNVDARSRV